MNKIRISIIIICIAVNVIALADETTGTEQAVRKDPFAPVISIKPVIDSVAAKVPVTVVEEARSIEEPRPAPPLFIATAMLKFLSAKSMSPAVTQLLSEYGSVSTDDETNTLVICDSRENIDRIIEEIRKADRTPKQIQVEVVILDVTLSDDNEIGVNWADLNVQAGYTQSLSTLTNGGSLNIIQDNISTTVKALQKVRNVEILASPRVLVVSGRTASISTIEEIPYEELSQSSGGVGTSDAITSTAFKTAGITLTVKATITDDGKILMHVTPDQSVDTGSPGLDGRVPIVNRRSVDTSLLLEDGQVVAMGGLRRKDKKIMHDKIPLLGDIPFIGFLFSNDRTVVTESELLVLISPSIYRDDAEIPAQQKQIFNELKGSRHLRLTETELKAQEIKPRPEYEMIRKAMPSGQRRAFPEHYDMQ